jgi:hypothetical protein
MPAASSRSRAAAPEVGERDIAEARLVIRLRAVNVPVDAIEHLLDALRRDYPEAFTGRNFLVVVGLAIRSPRPHMRRKRGY